MIGQLGVVVLTFIEVSYKLKAKSDKLGVQNFCYGLFRVFPASKKFFLYY